MRPNLADMTNTELKRYMSKHRNDDEAFHAAMEVMMSRRNPANQRPYPLDLKQAEAELRALLEEQQKKRDEGDR